MPRLPLKKIYILLLLCGFSLASAQNSLTAKAEKSYRDNDFITALPLYTKLVQTYRTNGVYHHRLGVCILETGGNLTEAEKHLKYARNKGIRYANFFLGQVYKKQYKFEDAIATYTTYLRGIRSDNDNYPFVKKEIEQCELLQTYLQRTEKIELLSAKVVPAKDFHTHYRLSKESGKIITTAELDAATDSSFAMYMNELGDRICYPRIIGDTLDTDLFSKSRLLDKWGAEERLSNVVNSEGNELFPYILDDGITLYFSSNGHGGLGGYDIFVTRYNPQTNTYLPPANLGMPYNSMGDDFLFAKDEFNGVGWFASNRNNVAGEITVYSFKPNAIKKISELQGDSLIWTARLLTHHLQGDSSRAGKQTAGPATKVFAEEDRAIYFVVNDTLIYKSTLQFVSAQALHLYKTGEQNLDTLAALKVNLEREREAFSSLKTEEERQKASRQIMLLENRIYDMESQLEAPFQQARNKEMGLLKMLDFQVFQKEDYLVSLEPTPPIDTPMFQLPTIQENYTLIFSDDEIRQFLTLENAAHEEKEAIALLEVAEETIRNKENSTTDFWRKLRTIDTTFQYADTLANTLDLSTQHLQENYNAFLNHGLDKVDLLEKKAQLLYLFVRGNTFQNNMKKLLDKAGAEKNKATGQLMQTNDSLLSSQQFYAIQNSIQNCQELFEFSLVYYIEDYGGSLSLVSDSLVNDSAYIASLAQRGMDTIQTSGKPVQNATNASGRLSYNLQLGVFSKPVSPEITKALKNISVNRMDDSGLLKYMMGPYPTADAARNDIKTAEKYGFKGAFVVPFIDGNQVTWEEEQAFKSTQ